MNKPTKYVFMPVHYVHPQIQGLEEHAYVEWSPMRRWLEEVSEKLGHVIRVAENEEGRISVALQILAGEIEEMIGGNSGATVDRVPEPAVSVRGGGVHS